jgi:hypothetical protein
LVPVLSPSSCSAPAANTMASSPPAHLRPPTPLSAGHSLHLMSITTALSMSTQRPLPQKKTPPQPWASSTDHRPRHGARPSSVGRTLEAASVRASFLSTKAAASATPLSWTFPATIPQATRTDRAELPWILTGTPRSRRVSASRSHLSLLEGTARAAAPRLKQGNHCVFTVGRRVCCMIGLSVVVQ